MESTHLDAPKGAVMSNAFRGTLNECFDALRSLERQDIIKFIDFVKVHPGTLAGWLFGITKPPTGEFWLRSVIFFQLSGWQVTEFETVDEVANSIARLWMYGVMDFGTINEEIGYSAASNTPLLEWMYGKRQPIKSTYKLARLLVASRHDQLRTRELQLRQQFGLLSRGSSAQRTETKNDDTVRHLAELLKEVAPLAHRIASDEFSDTDRERLRHLVGTENYVELAVMLNAMKSFRTREQAQKSGAIKNVSK
jgi:hypothetical protein